MKKRSISHLSALCLGLGLLFGGVWIAQTGVPQSMAQEKPVSRDWDGILEQGEVPDPRIDYTRPRLMPTRVADPSHRPSACSPKSARKLAAPRVEIESLRRTAQGAEQAILARGFVEGECLSTAGLYVDGVLKEPFEVHTQPSSKRFPFFVALKSSTGAEIRVYTVTRDVAVAEVR